METFNENMKRIQYIQPTKHRGSDHPGQIRSIEWPPMPGLRLPLVTTTHCQCVLFAGNDFNHMYAISELSNDVNVNTIDSRYISLDYDTLLNTQRQRESFSSNLELTKYLIPHPYGSVGCLLWVIWRKVHCVCLHFYKTKQHVKSSSFPTIYICVRRYCCTMSSPWKSTTLLSVATRTSRYIRPYADRRSLWRWRPEFGRLLASWT